MPSIGQRIKNLFGFGRPKSAKLVTGPARIWNDYGRSGMRVEPYRPKRRDVGYIPTGSFPYPVVPVMIERDRSFDPTPMPISPEPFVGGGGESGGGGASGGWDSGSSSSCDSGGGSCGGGC